MADAGTHMQKALARRIADFKQAHGGHPPKVMLLTESDQSFGHARVCSTLAKHIRELGGEVAVVSGDIEDKKPFDFEGTLKKLPRVDFRHKVENGKTGDIAEYTESGTLYAEDARFQEKRKNALLEIAKEIKPDIIAFEFFPVSWRDYRADDLKALLEYRKDVQQDKEQGNRHIPFISIARDESAKVCDWDKRKEIANHFNRILVRGWQGVDWKEASAIPEDIEKKISYLGHILADFPANDNLPPEEDRPVIVYASGRYLAEDRQFFEKAIEAAGQGEFAQKPWKLAVSTECPGKVFRALQEQAAQSANKRITLTHTYDNGEFSRDLAGCDMAISRGGYNLSLELVKLRKPFVVIPHPFPGIAREQENRGRHIASLQRCKLITQPEIEQDEGLDKLLHVMREAKSLDLSQELQDIDNSSRFAGEMLQMAMASHDIARSPSKENRAAEMGIQRR